MKLWSNSPVHIPKYDRILPYAPRTANSSPIAINSVTSTNTPHYKLMETNVVSPQQVTGNMEDSVADIQNDSTPAQVTKWLTYQQFDSHLATFKKCSGFDILRMSKEDLVQFCGGIDGVMMYNRLRENYRHGGLIYITLNGSSYYTIYITSNSAKELGQKIYKLPGFYEMCTNNISMSTDTDGNSGFSNWGMHSKYSGSGSNIFNDFNKVALHLIGPFGVPLIITDEVVKNEIRDRDFYALEVKNGLVLMKLVNQNDDR